MDRREQKRRREDRFKNAFVVFVYIAIGLLSVSYSALKIWEAIERTEAAIPLWCQPGLPVKHLPTNREGIVAATGEIEVVVTFPTGNETLKLLDLAPVFKR